MVLKGVRERLERFKAKSHGMTVPELREHMKKRKAEMKKLKEGLRQKKRSEYEKHEHWKVEQKYREKRKRVRQGKPTGILSMLGGSPSKSSGGYDPFGLFSSPKKPRKKSPRKKSTQRKSTRRRRKR